MGLTDGKICLVTGARRGIGAATAKRIAEEGTEIYVNNLMRDGLADVCAA